MKDDINLYFDKPHWILDILPKQVSENGKGQYFKVERHFLSHPERLYPRFAQTLIKLNCYEDFDLGNPSEKWIQDPDPETIEIKVTEGFKERKNLLIALKSADTLITFNGDDHYMTVYNPNDSLLDLLRALATAEGLFFMETINIPFVFFQTLFNF